MTVLPSLGIGEHMDRTSHTLTGAAALRRSINERLERLVDEATSSDPLGEAVRYAVLAPGKRLRPLICVLSAQCLGANPEHALAPACAIEMVHTASLVIDDLPAMDDAQLRRGQPACHLRFGEATAILTALELLSLGYRTMSTAPGLTDAQRNTLVRVLARSVGINGLIGGQERDLAASAHDADTDRVEHIHALKTGALFVAAAESGATVAGLEGEALVPIRQFASQLGLAYQTLDDLLDVSGTPATAGKDVRKDERKPTLVGVLGTEAAADYANTMLVGAIEALRPLSEGLGTDMSPLTQLVQSVIGDAAADSSRVN